MKKREATEWCNIWVSGADTERLPRVLLFGDSITRSYYAKVQKVIGEQFLCSYLTTSKSVCDPSFRNELRLVLDDYAFALIHFNNGLHGKGYTETSYQKHFSEIVRFLRERAKDCALIIATSTPARKPDNLNKFDPFTERVRERNRIAATYAVANNIPVNNLFAAVKTHPEYYDKDGLHFNLKGQTVLGQQVGRCILEQWRRNAKPGARATSPKAVRRPFR